MNKFQYCIRWQKQHMKGWHSPWSLDLHMKTSSHIQVAKYMLILQTRVHNKSATPDNKICQATLSKVALINQSLGY